MEVLQEVHLGSLHLRELHLDDQWQCLVGPQISGGWERHVYWWIIDNDEVNIILCQLKMINWM